MTGARRVRRAVIPAAGLGTRFLPATKSQPKEMLVVVDKPAIQYVVEEAVGAGLDDVVVVSGRGKATLEDHFDRAFELERRLESSGKAAAAEEVRAIAALATVHYVRQGEPLGLGHAVATARRHVGDEPFAVLLPDDLLGPGSRALAEMLALHARTGGSVVALREVERSAIASYGAVRPDYDGDGLLRITGVVEKPHPDEAPSCLAITGRYVLTPRIFELLEQVEPGRGGEIQLTDAMARLLEEEPLHGYVLDEPHYDIGDKLGFLRATVELAAGHPELGPAFAEFLDARARRQGTR